MFDKDYECVSYALMLWANHIETGDINMNQSDVITAIKSFPEQECYRDDKRVMMEKLRNLTDDQKSFVMRLRTLATHISTRNIRLA